MRLTFCITHPQNLQGLILGKCFDTNCENTRWERFRHGFHELTRIPNIRSVTIREIRVSWFPVVHSAGLTHQKNTVNRAAWQEFGERTRLRVRWWTPSSTTPLRATAQHSAPVLERRALARVGPDREGAVGHTRGRVCSPCILARSDSSAATDSLLNFDASALGAPSICSA